MIALSNLARFTIHAILAWRAADWWNRVLVSTHDRNHKVFEEEVERLDQARDVVLPIPVRPPDTDLLFLIYQETMRLRARIEQTRIEEHARHDALTSRSQFSDSQIVMEWLRNRNKPNVSLDTGTTRSFISNPEAGQKSGSDPDPGHNAPNRAAQTDSPPAHVGLSLSAAIQKSSSQVAGIPIMTPATFAEEEFLRGANLLEVLASQRGGGLLTPEEFAQQKAKLLNG